MIVLFFIGLLVVTGILITRLIFNMRRRLIDAEKSKQRLKEEFEAKLRDKEDKRRDFEEKMLKVENERGRLESALRRLVAYQEAFEKAQRTKNEQYEAERKQFQERLLESEEGRKKLSSELQKAIQSIAQIQEEERRKLLEVEQHLQSEKDRWNRTQKEMAETLEVQKKNFEEQLRRVTNERNHLKETLREMFNELEELRLRHVMEKQQWESAIGARDKVQREMTEKFDAQRRYFEEKLLIAEEERNRLKEEIRQKTREENERRRQQAEEEQRGEAEQLKQRRRVSELEAECQQLKEILFKTQKEYQRFELVNQKELERLKIELQQLREKRKQLLRKLREVKPIDRRGGRGQVIKEEENRPLKKRPLKPEIICWKEGQTWIIGVECPEGLDCQGVYQEGTPLECNNMDGNRYALKQIGTGVEITWREGNESIPLLKFGKDYLIFKMRNRWKDPGRLVRYSTTGYYLIIAPKDWERDIEISGSTTIITESTQFPEFRVNFFYLEKTGINTIGLITSEGKRVRVDSKSPRFKLVGNEICDASEDKGPLFGQYPPRIQAVDVTRGWTDVGLIIVGEEGGGRNRWRDSFVPNPNMMEQTAFDELINGRSGWYFLRVYDKNDDLIESMDFRFLRNLRDIKIEYCSSGLPKPTGHENAIVKFLHHPDCMVTLKDEDKQHLLHIHLENDQTSVNVPRDPHCDNTNWILNDRGVEIEVSIVVERIWWSLGPLEAVPRTWDDRPIPLSRKDFNAITDNALWVRFPRPRFVEKIGVGFDREKSRFYRVEVEKQEVPIPLRDFCDCEEIQSPIEKCFFQIFVDSPNGQFSAPVLIIITSFACKYCSYVTNSEQEILLHASVHINNIIHDLIPHLSYEELRKRFRGALPRQIYRCGYCSFYVKTDDMENPTSEICYHIEQKHVRARIYFSIVEDIDELRENVLINLPHIYKCEICRMEFIGSDTETMLNHLKITHKDRLFNNF